MQCLETSSVFPSQEIRSFDCTQDGRRFVIGTINSEIYQLSTSDLTISSNSKYQESVILRAPFAPSNNENSLMQGLDVFTQPELAERFITCAEDNILRIWSTAQRKLMGYMPLEISDNSRDAKAKLRLTCLALSPREDRAAVGYTTGLIKVYLELIQIVDLQHMKVSHQIETTKAAITILRYSPDSENLAVGTRDNSLEIYSTNDNKRRAALKKYSGPVNHLDWSIDTGLIQTTSEAAELIFIESEEMKQITTLDEFPELLNETWISQTCVYGWSVQGVWREYMGNGNEVKMLDRSHKKFYGEYHALAAVDDFGDLRVYKYPCVQPDAQAIVARGHSSYVSNVKWTADDRHLITTGGEDNTIIIWRVEKTG